MSTKAIFVYNGQSFMRCAPAKTLLRSNTVADVVTRGDFFAVNLATSVLTVLPKGADMTDEAKNSRKKVVESATKATAK